jgi:urease accessory protein
VAISTIIAITAPDAIGNVGRLTAVAGLAGGRTVLSSLRSEGTLKAMRIHRLDTTLPGMAFLTVASPGGGVLQGDRLEFEISVEAGAQLHVGTTSATRVYAMPAGHAEATTRVDVAGGGYAELVPDAFIPFAGSRYVARSRHTVAEGGALLLVEVVGPGRQARGESLAYDLFKSESEVRRPDGGLLFRDTTLLRPAGGLDSLGLLSRWRALGVLYAIAEGLEASVFDATIEDLEREDLHASCSELPNQAGAWFRVMAADAPSAHEAVVAAWTAARVRLLGSPPPVSRRY